MASRTLQDVKTRQCDPGPVLATLALTAGTDPNNANSVLQLTKVKPQPGSVLLNWQGGTNIAYYVQRSSSVTNSTLWRDIFTNPPSLTITGAFSDLTATNPANYYRIRSQGF